MFLLPLRNVFRHRRRSAGALVAIAFSVIVLTLSGGFIEWIFWAMREAATESGSGHIQVMRPGYLESGAADPFSFALAADAPELATIKATAHVKAVAPRLNFSGLMSHDDATLAFIGTGVDIATENVVSPKLGFVAGANLDAEGPDAVIVGMGLAHQLGVDVGDRVVLLINTQSGNVNAVELPVKGIFATQVKAVDDVAVRVSIATARKLMRIGGAHQWIVLLDDSDAIEPALIDLRERLARSDLQLFPWWTQADFYVKTVALLSTQVNVMRWMIACIMIIGISNVLIMNVLERTGEVGTLMAMGSRKAKILVMFVCEGLFLGLLGATGGVVISIVLAWLISKVGIPMPPPPGRTTGYSAEILLTWPLTVIAFVIAVCTTVIASLYPAWKASRLVVVDALRHNR